MDLNLYLAIPRSPRRLIDLEDLGLDLSLGSIPMEDNLSTPLASSRTENDSTDYRNLLHIVTEVVDINIDDNNNNNVDVDAPFTPASVSTLPTMNEADEFVTVTPLSNPRVEVQEIVDGCSPPPPNPELLQFPEFRFRRLIESNDRLQHRRFRSSVPCSGERSRPSDGHTCSTEDLIRNIVAASRSMRSSRMEKNIDLEDSEETGECNNKVCADFDCNVCLDVANEPVVTSCGHLFCWPCLYQWLHIHSGHKECPVCKGEVMDANITPIYGKGSSRGETEENNSETEGDLSGFKIPPRPQGHRQESLRQQLQRQLLRRFGEGISWRRFFYEEIHGDQTRVDGNRESNSQEVIEVHRALVRMRERRLRRRDGNSNNTSAPVTGSMSSHSDDGDTWERIPVRGPGLSERLAAISADIDHVVESFGSRAEQLSRIRSANDTVTSFPYSDNPLNLERDSTRVPTVLAHASDQASASSTVTVIEGGAAVTPASAEPSDAGPSRPLRRRGRSRASSSLDVDGMLHESKRRRLN